MSGAPQGSPFGPTRFAQIALRLMVATDFSGKL
jgi:hypothetical protein